MANPGSPRQRAEHRHPEVVASGTPDRRPVGPDRVVGREAELAVIDAFLAAAWPRVLLVTGPAGIGKTTLLEAAVARAADAGAVALVARPTLAERDLPFAVLSSLLPDARIDPVAARLAVPRRRALEIALRRAPASGGDLDLAALGLAVLDVIRGLADPMPVVLVVDDLQWCDGPSAAALAFALRRASEVPVAVIGCVRTGVPSAPMDDLVRAIPGDRLERLPLGPLSLGAIGRIVEQRTARARGRGQLARLTDAAGGNPLLALEIVRAIDAGDVQSLPGQPLAIPASAEPLIGERLGRLPLAAHAVVIAVALAAGPTIAALQAALGRAAVDTGLEAGLRAGLLELDGAAVRLSHPLVGAAAVGLATPDRLRETHARLAVVTSNPEARARHLALSTDGPDPDIAAACDAAADEAVRRGAPEAAAELVELAIGRTDPDDRPSLAGRCRRAAALRVAIGDPERAREHIDAGLAAAAAPGEAVPLLLVGVELAHHVAGRPAARAAAAAALDAAGGDPILQARAHGAMVAWGAEDTSEERRHATAVLELLAGREDVAPEAAADALAILADSQLAAGGGPAFDLLERAMALDRRRSDFLIGSLEILAGNLATADRMDESRARWRESLERLERAGYESRRAATLTHMAWMEFRAGDYRRTGELLAAADALARDLGADNTGPRLYRAHLDAMLGDRHAVREAAAIGLPAARDAGNDWVAALWRRALGIDALLGGEPDVAAGHLQAALGTALALGLREPNWARIDADLVEALVGAGRLVEADEALEAFGARLASARLPWSVVAHARAAAVLRIARDEGDDALHALEEVAGIAADLPLVVERGRFDLVRGIALRRLRRVRQARTALERACAAFDAAPTPPLAARARSELARLGGRQAAGHELTSAERQVAQLAAAGRSNREIADELVVSVRTVESQLSAVYAKLGVRGRAALGPALARDTMREG